LRELAGSYSLHGSSHPRTSQGLRLQLALDERAYFPTCSLWFPALACSPPDSSQFISSALCSRGDCAIVCGMIKQWTRATDWQSSDRSEYPCQASTQVKVRRVALRAHREIPCDKTALFARNNPNLQLLRRSILDLRCAGARFQASSRTRELFDGQMES